MVKEYAAIGVVAAAFAGLTIFTISADGAVSNDAPDINLQSLNSRHIQFDVTDAESVTLVVNDSTKRTVKTGTTYRYDSEFPIREARVVTTNQTGKSVKIYDFNR